MSIDEKTLETAMAEITTEYNLRGLQISGTYYVDISAVKKILRGVIEAAKASGRQSLAEQAASNPCFTKPIVKETRQPDDCREAFEQLAFARMNPALIERDEHGVYKDEKTRIGWSCFKKGAEWMRVAPKRESVKEGYTQIPSAALAWLFGEEGEFEPDAESRGGKFWWRGTFHRMIKRIEDGDSNG